VFVEMIENNLHRNSNSSGELNSVFYFIHLPPSRESVAFGGEIITGWMESVKFSKKRRRKKYIVLDIALNRNTQSVRFFQQYSRFVGTTVPTGVVSDMFHDRLFLFSWGGNCRETSKLSGFPFEISI